MNCPICGLRSYVLDTREDSFTRMRRRRSCENGHRFSTIEVVVDNKGHRLQKYARNQQMKAMYDKRQNYSEVARHFGVSNTRVREIVQGAGFRVKNS